jgi:excisionase family DNA binding protein
MRHRPDNTSEHRSGIGSVRDSCNRVKEIFMENSLSNEVAFLPRAADVPERFVDSETAAKFLSISQKWILLMARQGELPAHPLGQGHRRIWRFRLSELTKAMEERTIYKKGMGTLAQSKSSRPNR